MNKLTKTLLIAIAVMTCSISTKAARVPDNNVIIVNDYKSENAAINKDHGSESTSIFIGYYEEDDKGNPKGSITGLKQSQYYNNYYFDKEVLLPELECPGYTFEGYLIFGPGVKTLEKQMSIPAGFTTYENVSEAEGDDKLVICEAIFTPCIYTVTFNGIDDVNNKDELKNKLNEISKRTYDYKSEKWDKLPETSDPLMKRDGYSFSGWRVTSVENGDKDAFEIKCGVHEDGYIYGVSECSIGNVTIEATWKEYDYFITYDPNGGSGNAYTEKYDADEIKTKTELKVWTPKKSGYDFMGWYIKGNKIEFTTDITSHVATAYAYWFPESGKAIINYDTNGGKSIDSESYEVKNGQLPTVKFPTPEREGYKFICWKDTDGKKITESNYMMNYPAEITLVAEWEELAKKEEKKNDDILTEQQKQTTVVKNTEIQKTTEITTTQLTEMTSSTYRNVKLNATKITKANKKQIKYKKIKYAEKYEIQVSNNKKMKSAKKYTTTKTTYKIKGLKSKKKYYVRVRGYIQNVDKTMTYSKWSKIKKIK